MGMPMVCPVQSRAIARCGASSSDLQGLLSPSYSSHATRTQTRRETPARRATLSTFPCVALLAEHARRPELVDLGHHPRVLHGLLCCRGVLLEVPDDLHDDGVVEQALDLRVGHGVREALLVAARRRVDGGDDPLEAVAAERVRLVDVEPLLVRLERLVVLLGEELEVSLLGPGLDVLVVQLDGLLHRLEGPLEVADLLERRREVVADGRVLRVALRRLLVLCDGPGVVAGAELLIA
mmetsp:Transcript_10719/g.32520  ORF Transcript_10719/g.32520 Transcript_10719/m.32520 type:complete len:237 (+) Transcript_10719:164-874(+)